MLTKLHRLVNKMNVTKKEYIHETLNVEKNEMEFDVIMKINHAFDLLCFYEVNRICGNSLLI